MTTPLVLEVDDNEEDTAFPTGGLFAPSACLFSTAGDVRIYSNYNLDFVLNVLLF